MSCAAGIELLVVDFACLISRRSWRKLYGLRGDAMVSSAWAAGWRHVVLNACWCLGHRLCLRRAHSRRCPLGWKIWRRSALLNSKDFGGSFAKVSEISIFVRKLKIYQKNFFFRHLQIFNQNEFFRGISLPVPPTLETLESKMPARILQNPYAIDFLKVNIFISQSRDMNY